MVLVVGIRVGAKPGKAARLFQSGHSVTVAEHIPEAVARQDHRLVARLHLNAPHLVAQGAP